MLAELGVLLAGTLTGYELMLGVREILARLRPAPSAEAIRWVSTLAAGEIESVDTGLTAVGPAQKVELAMAPKWRALYLVAASERLRLAEQADKLRDAELLEETYFAHHLMAEERRLRSAALVDSAARLLSDRTETPDDLVGWRAVLDERTTPDCRAAHGKNFVATRMPEPGWPGAVHPRCRCSVGPATPGAPLIPSL